MDIAARVAAPEDLDDLVALSEAASDELRPTRGGDVFLRREARAPGADTLTADLDDPNHRVVVGTFDGATVGFGLLHLEPVREEGLLGVIEVLYVLPEGRGVGVGEAMMDDLVAFCRNHGCLGIDAVALPGNRATKNFFETFGLTARAILVHRSLEPPS